MLKALVTCFILLMSQWAITQSLNRISTCEQQERSNQIIKLNPELSDRLNKNEIELQNWISTYRKSPKTQTLITIPVVFHILYTSDIQNISTDRILAQVEVLNTDFRRLNPDTVLIPERFKPITTDTEIEFCMAQQTPDGNLTNGIIRKKTSISSIGNTKSYYQPTKGGSQIWDPRYYLNVWVCEISDTLLGYTYLPGVAQPNFDGIVLNYKVCGNLNSLSPPYNKGRTLVHEVGHWLNLIHIWGPKEGCDFDDAVSDTPMQEKPNTQCPSGIPTSCNNSPTGDMHMNYMDYTYDRCKIAFTKGQKERMHGTLNTSRKLLQNSIGCILPDTNTPFQESIHIFPNPIEQIINVRYQLVQNQNTEIIIYDLTGRIIHKSSHNVQMSRVIIDLYHISPGGYIITISSNSINKKSKFIKTK